MLETQEDNYKTIKNKYLTRHYEHVPGWIPIIHVGMVKSTEFWPRKIYGLVYQDEVVETTDALLRNKEKNTKNELYVWMYQLVCVSIIIQ